MNQKWIYTAEPDEETVDALSTSLGFGTFESKILVMRGIDNYQKAREFFKPNLNDIHNPFPVSYTHLDVYKRQRFRSGKNRISTTEIDAVIFKF